VTAIDDAADAAAKAAEEASALAKKTGAMMEEIDTFLEDLEQMIVIKRPVPRTEDELWDEDVQRLKELRAAEADLVARLKAAGGNDDDRSLQAQINTYLHSMWSGTWTTVDEIGWLSQRIVLTRDAIAVILFYEPGVIPETIYSVKEVLERFRTLEQPLIEDIMERSEDTIRETSEILAEVKKLFFTRRWVAKESSKLTVQEKAELDRLTVQKEAYATIIGKHLEIADLARKNMLPQIAAPDQAPDADTRPSGAGGATRLSGATGIRSISLTQSGSMSGQVALKGISSRFIKPKNGAYIDGYTAIQGSIRFFEREHLKVEKKIFCLSYEKLEGPGVIPETLGEVHLVVQRFRTEEQPRIEKILDVTTETLGESKVVLESVDDAVRESKNLLSQLNTSLGKVQGWFDFLSAYRVPLLAGCVCIGVLGVAIMITVLVVLIKMALA
jgi:hypothetical protein